MSIQYGGRLTLSEARAAAKLIDRRIVPVFSNFSGKWMLVMKSWRGSQRETRRHKIWRQNINVIFAADRGDV